MIQGYITPSSMSTGEKIKVHAGVVDDNDRTKAGTATKQFRTYFFRKGATWKLQGSPTDVWTASPVKPPLAPSSDPTKGYTAGDSTSNWKWPGFDFTIPKDWRSGVYAAVFVEENTGSVPPTNPDEDKYYYSRALFVVKVASADPGTGATILYKVPLFTYCAYNYEGKANLYDVSDSLTLRKFKAALHRPGCGLGGDPWDKGAVDVYDPSSPRQTFSHWDAPFISWLESNGYNVDYCTDLDIHENKDNFLQNYSLLLSVGHDEYWSQEMRTNVENFIAQGGNVAFFSGNTCWWRVHLEEGNTALTCDKTPQSTSTPADQWMTVKPETTLTGVSYANAGGWWEGSRTPVGFTVQHPEHWVYNGTGLARGAAFGDKENEALVGYECDGTKLAPRASVAADSIPSHADGSPSTFMVLGVGQLDKSWDDPGIAKPDDPNAGSRERKAGDNSVAILGIWGDNGKGTIFTAGTTDWARVLAVGAPTPSRPVVECITKNVLSKLA